MTAAEHETKCGALPSTSPVRPHCSCAQEPGPARGYTIDRDTAVPAPMPSVTVFATNRCGLVQGGLGLEVDAARHPD